MPQARRPRPSPPRRATPAATARAASTARAARAEDRERAATYRGPLLFRADGATRHPLSMKLAARIALAIFMVAMLPALADDGIDAEGRRVASRFVKLAGSEYN